MKSLSFSSCLFQTVEPLCSVMAAASISHSSSAAPDAALEDYSIYSNLSDDQLLQLAIERSLTETHCSTTDTTTQPSQSHSRLNSLAQTTNQHGCSSHNPPDAQTTAHYSSPNPPEAKPPDLYVTSVFIVILPEQNRKPETQQLYFITKLCRGTDLSNMRFRVSEVIGRALSCLFRSCFCCELRDC